LLGVQALLQSINVTNHRLPFAFMKLESTRVFFMQLPQAAISKIKIFIAFDL